AAAERNLSKQRPSDPIQPRFVTALKTCCRRWQRSKSPISPQTSRRRLGPANHASPPCANCPSRQLAAGVRTCGVGAKHFTFLAVPRPSGGAYRDRHERRTRDATAVVRLQMKVRALTDSEVAWSLCLDAGIKLASDGHPSRR